MDGEHAQHEAKRAEEAEDYEGELERRIVRAFRRSFSRASVAPGGSVYDQQVVRGLSDADPDAPLVASLHLSRSGRVVKLGGKRGGGGLGGRVDVDEGDVDGDGQSLVMDVHRSFLAQSCFKPLTYAMALEMGLGDEIGRAVGCTGDVGFGTFDREPSSRGGRAFNPLINSGALVVLERLSRTRTIDEVGRWCRGIGGGGGGGGGDSSSSRSPSPPLFDPVAVRATEEDSLRNRGLSCSLASAGLIPKTDDAVDRAVRYYASMDCLLTDCDEMASIAAAFASAGPADDGGVRTDGSSSSPPPPVLKPATRSAVLATMLHCGMYEESGTWARDVGVPAKSGVSGAVWATIPGVGGMCAHQPRIDGRGNSVQAMELIRGMVALEPSIGVFHP